MVTLFYNTNILAIALPSLRISPLLLIRIVTIVLLCAAALSLSVVYIQSIGSGPGVFSRLFSFFSENNTLISIFLNGNLMHYEIHQVPLVYLLLSSLPPVKPRPRLTELKKSQFTLSYELEQIIVGLLLGDLCAFKRQLNVRLMFKQGIVHEDYIMHLYEIFNNYCPSEPKIKIPAPDGRTGIVYKSIYFNTYTLPCFIKLYNLFYPKGVKVVPSNILELLTPLGLAYMICDDGSFNKRGGAVILCTDGFTLKNVELLVSVLTDKFNLKCTIYIEKNGFRIRISNKSLPILQTLLKDIMPPMMLHKIGL